MCCKEMLKILFFAATIMLLVKSEQIVDDNLEERSKSDQKSELFVDNSPVIGLTEKSDFKNVDDESNETVLEPTIEGIADTAEKISNNAQNVSSNITSDNITSDLPAHRWPCKSFNITGDGNSSLNTVIMNNETELNNLFDRMNSSNGCGLVLFYSPYCEFCVEMASLYNAVGRSYSDLIVIAVDAQEAMGMSARYGVSAIPTVFFFYCGKAVARFNRSRSTEHFQGFIKELSGFNPVNKLNITEIDRIGPIQITVKESKDYYMIFSVTFLLLFIVTRVFGSMLWRTICGTAVYLKSIVHREKID